MNGRMEGLMDGWMARWMGGWMDGGACLRRNSETLRGGSDSWVDEESDRLGLQAFTLAVTPRK